MSLVSRSFCSLHSDQSQIRLFSSRFPMRACDRVAKAVLIRGAAGWQKKISCVYFCAVKCSQPFSVKKHIGRYDCRIQPQNLANVEEKLTEIYYYCIVKCSSQSNKLLKPIFLDIAIFCLLKKKKKRKVNLLCSILFAKKSKKNCYIFIWLN